jgi:hypothetical protein
MSFARSPARFAGERKKIVNGGLLSMIPEG